LTESQKPHSKKKRKEFGRTPETDEKTNENNSAEPQKQRKKKEMDRLQNKKKQSLSCKKIQNLSRFSPQKQDPPQIN